MRFTLASPMLLVGTLVVATAVGAVTPVGAQTPMSDAAYLNLARCTGLADGLGRDATVLKAQLAGEGRGRMGFVYDRAEETRADAAREARHGGEDARRHLTAESDGACAAQTAQTKPTTVAGR